MATFLFLTSFFQILGFTTCTAVTLKTAGNASVGNQFCPGRTAEFECTTEGSLLWEITTTGANHIFDNPAQSSTILGIFLLQLDEISLINGTVSAVNSTAVVSNVQPSYNGTALRCSEFADPSIFRETVLRIAGPPPAPAVNPITVVDEGSINSTLLISWSQSNCSVQYVVTIINSSDDRVYPNITTSHTNTTVTLPTGVVFCVILVAVDNISRRGPDSVPICHINLSATSSSVNQLFTSSPVMSSVDQIVTSISTAVSMTFTLLPATPTPVFGGTNGVYTVVGSLVVAIIIIVVIALLVTAAIIYKRRQQDTTASSLEITSMKQLSPRRNRKDCMKSKYKDFLRDYYRDPLPSEGKLFLSSHNKRGYVELAIVEKDEKTIHSPETAKKFDSGPTDTIALNDILRPDVNEESVHLVLIKGTSGIGKTTLAWQLCHKWANEKLDSLKGFDLAIFVRLRGQTATKFKDLLPHDNTCTTDMEDLKRAIGRGKGVLIVCDGFDELSRDQQKNQLYVRLFSCELLPEATVIVTTRPSASKDFKMVSEKSIHRELEITGFTQNGIMGFAKSIFSTDVLDGFLTYIQNNPPISSMMHLPLSAVIVAKIYEESYKTGTSFPNTMSELFDAFTRFLVQAHHKSTDESIAMPSSLQDIRKLPHVAAQRLFRIVEIAYDGICDSLYDFDDLANSEDFEHLGLMRKVTREKIDRGRYVTYVFFHQTLQEYLAALHIANKLSSDLNSLKLQLEKKYMIARFLAGICVSDHHDYSNDLRQWFTPFLGQICFDRSRALQMVHCAYECSKIMHDLKVEYSEKNAFIVVLPKVGIDWYAMGHCISHFDERWGLHAKSLRKVNIDLLEKGLKSPHLTSAPGSLKYLYVSKSDVSIAAVITSLGEFSQLEWLELLNVNVDEKDEKVLKLMIAVDLQGRTSGPKRLTYQTDNEYTHTSSLIPMLLNDSSLEELVLRTGSVVHMNTELLPHSNTNLKKLTISCELVQPLVALLSNTSLTHLVIDSLVYDSDLPMLKSLIESHSTLQVLELGKIDLTPKPCNYFKSSSCNLHELAQVASNSQLKKLKLDRKDYNYLQEYHNNSTVCY